MELSRKFFGLVFGSLFLVSFIGNPAGALAASANAAQGMQISPTLVELNAARGNTYSITLNVTNITDYDLFYSSSIDDFGAADETGSPRIILDSILPKTASIKTWVTNVADFNLQSHMTKTINAQIVVPDDAEPGGHYGVLRFSGRAPEMSSTGVGLSASAGVLMLVSFDGAITEKASLASFYTELNGKQSPFFENSPIKFVTRIKNDGNVHVKPFGNIEIRDMFGNTVKTITVNPDKSNILPQSIRRFESQFDKPWMIGVYTADLTLGYGTTGQAITNSIKFWVIPYKIILAVLLSIITIVYIFSRLIKVYNKRITEKVKNEIAKENKNKVKK